MKKKEEEERERKSDLEGTENRAQQERREEPEAFAVPTLAPHREHSSRPQREREREGEREREKD